MGGNDKLKPSDLNDSGIIWRLQRDFFLLPLTNPIRVSLFYDISGSRMHHCPFRKTQGVADARTAGKVTDRTLIAIGAHADIMRACKIIVLF
jgi:hypothetical protein